MAMEFLQKYCKAIELISRMGPISVEMYAWRKVKAKLSEYVTAEMRAQDQYYGTLSHSLQIQFILAAEAYHRRLMMITLEQLIQFFGATVLLTFSFTDKDGDDMSIVYVQQACNIIGLQKSWRIAVLMTMAME